jgi:hypothetical protein
MKDIICVLNLSVVVSGRALILWDIAKRINVRENAQSEYYSLGNFFE